MISSIVRAHPLQNPVVSSSSQMPTHGEAISVCFVMPSLPVSETNAAAQPRLHSSTYENRADVAIPLSFFGVIRVPSPPCYAAPQHWPLRGVPSRL